MTEPLARRLGLGARELVAFTGAGGKSTLMLALAAELAGTGKRVLVTTTTKMGRDQLTSVPEVCRHQDLPAVTKAVRSNPFVALITGGDDHKATGPPPETVDVLYRAAPVDYLLVEADGAHGRSLKAPGPHEPVIPSETTTVVVMMGVDAVGGRIADVAHRPEQAAALTGLEVTDRLDARACVEVVTHREGGLKGVPPAARVVIGLTRSGAPGADRTAQWIADHLGTSKRVSRVVVIPGR